MQKITRHSLLTVALAAGVCTFTPGRSARAQEKMSDDHTKMAGESMMKMSPEEMKMAGQHMDHMKMMAAENPQETAAHLAEVMVMDRMAIHMAMDPDFAKMLHQSMADPKMKQVHDDAKKMAEDPAQMAKMKQKIMDDPNAMRLVVHMATVMTMMHDGMMHDGMMHEGMMKDGKMKDMPAEKK